jgi:hypothetical protein
MGFDTECDLAIEVTAGTRNSERLRGTIRLIQRKLLCEHLGVTAKVFSSAVDEHSGSLLRTLNALIGGRKTLKPLLPSDLVGEDSELAENELMDPEHTPPTLTDRVSSNLRILWR